MKILAFDTSTESLSIAVGQRHGTAWTVHEHTGAGGARASAALIPQALRLLREAGLSLAELDAIAFGAGPGSFTGLRTACSVAQGLVFGAGGGVGGGAESEPALKVLPVPTLMAVAEDARQRHGATRVLALLDARMDEVYAAAYEHADGRWHERSAPALMRPEAVMAPGAVPQALQGTQPAATAGGDPGSGWALAGNARDTYAGRWSQAAQALPHHAAMPTAAAMLRLAPALIDAGCAVRPEHAMPVYIRDKVAQTTEERAAAKAAATGVALPPTAT